MIETESFTVEYNENLILTSNNNSELKNLKDSRNKLISKKGMQEKEIDSINQEIDLMKKQSLLSPVKTTKTPKSSFLGINPLKFFENTTVFDNDHICDVLTTGDIDYDSLVIEQLESKISQLKKKILILLSM